MPLTLKTAPQNTPANPAAGAVVVQAETLHPVAERVLALVKSLFCLFGAACLLGIYGLPERNETLDLALYLGMLVSLLVPTVFLGASYLWSLSRQQFWIDHRLTVGILAAWILGCLFISTGALLLGSHTNALWEAILGWSEVIVILMGIIELVAMLAVAADSGLTPALVFVGSFVLLIGAGTWLLMLPRCNAQGEWTHWLSALFTATSACCVTGLAVVDTELHWSRTGQVVIMILIQLGGLGIMTFGAFFTVALAGSAQVRQAATMRDMLESESISDVRRLIVAILGFTFAIEFIGALALSTLFADLPLSERLFHGVFHAVSSFCNAGFSTRSQSLLGWETRWQVRGVVAPLIILGGFGFMPMNNLRIVIVDFGRRICRNDYLSNRRAARMALHTRLVSLSTLGLLVVGGIVLLILEWNNPSAPQDFPSQLANAWFHSVTLRTAGFNTVDHALLYPATKLFGIALMFIGASPGSTGGGVKTVCFALVVLAIRSVLRSRNHVEAFGRVIPSDLILRSLAVVALGLATVMTTTMLLVIIEDKPDLLIDHLYEATSAFGTVGVSAGVTPTLRPASQFLLVLTMFLGRVGPLTLVVAVAGRKNIAEFSYPEERVTLG